MRSVARLSRAREGGGLLRPHRSLPRFGRGNPERVLPRLFRGLASLAKLVLGVLCLVSRLAELLSRLPGFALELLQFALETANLTLDSLDPVDRRILCVSRDRYHGYA